MRDLLRLGTPSLLMIAWAAAACSNRTTAPSEESPLSLSAQISQSVLDRGESTTITFRLVNAGSETVRLTFSSSCQLMPYITDRRTRQVVHPEGGSWACLAVITELVLMPGESTVREVQVRAAGAAPFPYVALPPGEYQAFARLDDRAFRLQSESVSFTVR